MKNLKKNKTGKLKWTDSWDKFQGSLANHPISKKYSTLQIIKMANKIEGKRIAREIDKMLGYK